MNSEQAAPFSLTHSFLKNKNEFQASMTGHYLTYSHELSI